MSGYVIPTIAGAAFGFGMASVAYLAVFTRALKQLHRDNVETALLLVQADTHLVRKVEEQNGGGDK